MNAQLTLIPRSKFDIESEYLKLEYILKIFYGDS